MDTKYFFILPDATFIKEKLKPIFRKAVNILEKANFKNSNTHRHTYTA